MIVTIFILSSEKSVKPVVFLGKTRIKKYIEVFIVMVDVEYVYTFGAGRKKTVWPPLLFT